MIYFSSLYKLVNNLKKANRHITVIDYTYNGVSCQIVVHRLPIYYQKIWRVKLSFYNPADHAHDFSCYANKVRMSFNVEELTAFFHITDARRGNMRQGIESFYSDFDQSVNTEIPDRYDGDDKNVLNRYIYENESIDDKDKIYLCGIRKAHGVKSALNEDKAAVRYPEIYSYFAKDSTVEYVFSEDKRQESFYNPAVMHDLWRNFHE